MKAEQMRRTREHVLTVGWHRSTGRSFEPMSTCHTKEGRAVSFRVCPTFPDVLFLSDEMARANWGNLRVQYVAQTNATKTYLKIEGKSRNEKPSETANECKFTDGLQ